MEKTAENTNKRKSQIPVAIAYFATLVICLGIFGGLGYFIIDKYVLNDKGSTSLEAAETGVPTKEDRLTVLYLQVDNSNAMKQSVLVRFLPDVGEIKIVPVSPYLMSAQNEGENASSLANIYSQGGVNGVTKAVENAMEISVDRYMTVSDAAFDNIVDYIGGVTVAPDEDINYSDEETGDRIFCKKGVMMSLDHSYLRVYMNYPDFSDGGMENAKVASDVLTRFINEMFLQSDNLRSNMDTFFNVIYTNSDTNMTKTEYTKNKRGIIYILENQTMPCESLTPTGTWNNDSFYVGGDFPQALKDFFELD